MNLCQNQLGARYTKFSHFLELVDLYYPVVGAFYVQAQSKIMKYISIYIRVTNIHTLFELETFSDSVHIRMA